MVSDKTLARQAPPPTICRSGPEAAAVETWVRRSFVDRYEDTLSEPLPQELVLLVAKLFH
jgi:hypothetical protein